MQIRNGVTGSNLIGLFPEDLARNDAEKARTWYECCLRMEHANGAVLSQSGFWPSHRFRHQGGDETSCLISAGMRWAFGLALFNSLGLVSGGLRKQAATLL